MKNHAHHILSGAAAAAVFLLLSCTAEQVQLSEIMNHSRCIVEINGTRINTEVACTPEIMHQGLGGRTSMPPDAGMLFDLRGLYDVSFWMKGMLFPLDALWIRDGKVIQIDANLPAPQPNEEPATFACPQQADAILEVNAGFAAEHNIAEGDAVRFFVR